MANGGTKDAVYIVNMCILYFKKMNPDKNLIDLVYFDGASNVQKVGVV